MKIIEINIDKSLRIAFFVSGAIIFAVYILMLSIPLPELKAYSQEIYSSEGVLIGAYLTQDEKWRLQSRLDEINVDLIRAIIAKEDRWFYYHYGINPIAVLRAMYTNLTKGRRYSGASTITMQLARLLEPADRNYGNKLLEMFRALQLEMRYSKKEILELYLSYLPMGGNIEGINSASYIYFNRPSSKLSLSQSILLTVIPNNPSTLRLDRNPIKVRKFRDKWINIFKTEGIFEDSELSDALNEEILYERNEIKFTAPHFCRLLRLRTKELVVKSTLDLEIQNKAESLLSLYVSKLGAKGISNGAVLVIDNREHKVSAYCGSADFSDIESLGQVDGITAIRSPGSTLKSGLYAYALDRGMLTPKMKLLDIPSDFEGYIPENFTFEFKGEVTMEYALKQSLNIPAVRLLKEVGVTDFVNHLKSVGFSEIKKSESKLGLSLILGGCGVSLAQLTTYYSSFACGGILYDFRFTEDDKSSKGSRIFSEGSAYIISEILSSNMRQDFPNELLHWTNLPKISWKTGTSYGKRDAWAIGYNPNYTIGVWLGNFEGKGSPHLSGAESAVPLLFEIFNAIDYGNKDWFEKPDDTDFRYVCSETGLIPTDNCEELIEDYFIKRVSHNKKCDLYREIFVDTEETRQYCRDCLPYEGYEKRLFAFYEPELMLWFNNNNITIRIPPAHNPYCQQKGSGLGPKILSPASGWEYYIERGTEQEIMLQAVSEAGITRHFWYIDDKFYTTAIPGSKVFYKPEKKSVTISCLDELGRKATIDVQFNYY